MNKKIDVCFLHAGTKIEEVVLNNLYSKTKKSFNLYESLIGDSYSESMNKLINEGSGDYVVICPSHLMVDSAWLEELVRYAEMIVNPGCVGIYDYLLMHKMKASSLLDKEDKLVSIWTTENYVEGVTLFNRSLISDKIGLFDKTFDKTGYEQTHFSIKFALEGLNNFYIRCKSTCMIRIAEREEQFVPKTDKGAELLNDFVKSNIQILNK